MLSHSRVCVSAVTETEQLIACLCAAWLASKDYQVATVNVVILLGRFIPRQISGLDDSVTGTFCADKLYYLSAA